MFQPKWDELGGKVRVFSNEKFGDSFVSSTMRKNCNWSSRNELNMEQSPETEAPAEWILRKCKCLKYIQTITIIIQEILYEIFQLSS